MLSLQPCAPSALVKQAQPTAGGLDTQLLLLQLLLLFGIPLPRGSTAIKHQ
jgi:hypothetical protein